MPEYYVSTSGDDTKNGSILEPWKTFSYAISRLVAGDTLFIRGGTYNQQFLMTNKNGTVANPITIQNYSGEKVIMDATGITFPPNEHGELELVGCAYIVIDGVSVENSVNRGIILWTSHHITVKNCYTYNTFNSGISTWYCHDLFITNNEIVLANNGGYDENISIASTSYNVEVSYNNVHDGGPGGAGAGGEGINIKDGCYNVIIHHNKVHDDPKLGFSVDAWTNGCHNIKFYDNEAYNLMYGYILESEEGGLSQDLWVYNNKAWNCSQAGYSIPEWGIAGPVDKLYFINNLAYSCQRGFWVKHANITNSFFVNNILSNNNVQIEQIKGSEGKVTIDNNLYYGNTTGYLGTKAIVGDPKFVNAGIYDFHLKSDSPAIGVGSFVNAPIDDFDGVIRGSLIDIGPYEFQGDNSVTTNVNMTGISSGNLPTDPVSITVSTDKPALFSNIVVNYSSPQPTGTIVLTPASGAIGVAISTVTVKNDKPTNNTTVRTFKVTFQTSATNPPTLDPIADIIITI